MKTTMQRTVENAAPRGRASEAGFAVPTVLMALVAVLALGAATVAASINAQSGTVRDQQSKRALAAAEAGVANALLRFNRVTTTGANDACAPLGGAAAGSSGWCPTGVDQAPYDDGSYSYRVKITAAVGNDPAHITIVSTGTVEDVSRRVSVRADTISENFKPFSGAASVIGLDSIYLNSNAVINAGVATNGNIGMDANSALNCNLAQVGPGKGFSPANGTSSCNLTEGTISLPPVIPGDVATNNSNSRICGLDPCNKTNWNASTKRLGFQSGGSLTLGAAGGTFNYAFCQVRLNQNSYMSVVRGADVRIWLLAPEDCQGEHYPLILEQNSKIEPFGSILDDGTNLAILIVGSATDWTEAQLYSNTDTFCSQGFILYAPRTGVSMNSNNEICGGIGAKSVTLASNVVVTATNGAHEWELPNVELPPHYGDPREFVECTATSTGADPASGC